MIHYANTNMLNILIINKSYIMCLRRYYLSLQCQPMCAIRSWMCLPLHLKQ